jgi:hypothetical protein
MHLALDVLDQASEVTPEPILSAPEFSDTDLALELTRLSPLVEQVEFLLVE